MSDKKDINFLYNKITNLEIIVETLYEVMVDNGMTTESDFDDRVRVNIEMVQTELQKVMEDMKKPDEDSESEYDGINPVYWGQKGDA